MFEFILKILKLIFGIKDAPEGMTTTTTTKPPTEVRKNWGDPPADVDVPEWKVIKIEPNGIRVSWQEKYGILKDEICVGLWASTTQYMLTWKDSRKVYLQKENIVSIDAQAL